MDGVTGGHTEADAPGVCITRLASASLCLSASSGQQSLHACRQGHPREEEAVLGINTSLGAALGSDASLSVRGPAPYYSELPAGVSSSTGAQSGDSAAAPPLLAAFLTLSHVLAGVPWGHPPAMLMHT